MDFNTDGLIGRGPFLVFFDQPVAFFFDISQIRQPVFTDDDKKEQSQQQQNRYG
jgi:hypothetical protein